MSWALADVATTAESAKTAAAMTRAGLVELVLELVLIDIWLIPLVRGRSVLLICAKGSEVRIDEPFRCPRVSSL
jgi:hypothetical protein